MTSIRKRLLVSIIFILTLSTLAVGIATYLGIRHEMDELYDANMRQLATMAADMVSEGDIIDITPATDGKWPRGEEIFLIQIWKNGSIIYTSHPVANFPLQEKGGFGRSYFHAKKWSYYQTQIEGKTIQISQELRERRDVIREVYNAIIIPEIIQFPIVSALIWILVSLGFRPLSRVSDLIQKRHADFMQPIAVESVPDEIKSLVSALNALLNRLENSLETQRRFTADAAHELRTPLTAVRLQLDILHRADSEQDRGDAISTLERGVNRSIHLVQQLLELARQQPDTTSQEPSIVNLGTIARSVADEQSPMATAKSITLHKNVDDIAVSGDANALTIMIGNLLNNAITYTQEGGIVEMRAYKNEATPILEIADNGIGIAPEDHARVYDRFYRVVGTGQSGSGLGLSIVNTIAIKHGIKITLDTGISGKGTCFRLAFPAA